MGALGSVDADEAAVFLKPKTGGAGRLSSFQTVVCGSFDGVIGRSPRKAIHSKLDKLSTLSNPISPSPDRWVSCLNSHPSHLAGTPDGCTLSNVVGLDGDLKLFLTSPLVILHC